MDDYEDNSQWQFESEQHMMWLDSEEGIEWANKWLAELGAEEVPSEYYEGVGE